MVFVNSMSDLFHKDIPHDFVDQVFETMEAADWHIFQVLTKRSTNMRRYINRRYAHQSCPKHIWLGVSVEDRQATSRVTHLKQCNATTRFLSIEPLLGDVGTLDLTGIHWVIVGGESGRGARPMKEEWVLSLQRQCADAGVPFFFKQWGRFGQDGIPRSKKENGRVLNGAKHDGMPA
jgi:protein gp37